MTSLFRNVQQVAYYAKFRPQYPSELYDFLIEQLAAPPTLAVDVGCGTGQATLALAQHFDKVIGIDPSKEQLDQIIIPPNANKSSRDQTQISFQVNDCVNGLASLEPASVACITAAQAAHWFDLPQFYAQANRVLRPGGILAMWTYGLVNYENKDVDRLVNQELYETILGKYWDPRRHFVEQKYKTLPTLEETLDLSSPKFVTTRMEDKFEIALHCTPAELIGYLRSWSAYNAYCAEHNGDDDNSDATFVDPVRDVENYLQNHRIESIRGTWPVTLVWSRKSL